MDDSAPAGPGGVLPDDRLALHEGMRTRYLNYALSVITSRALPDVRDGLKPVQRRILYTMWQQGITSDTKHRKCAKVVGDVMGSFHPHGDTAIYDALVRMAQPFSLRAPLVDGSGNFGSLDGDPPAAMRYTECRLSKLSNEMLTEIGQQTVHFRPNYDGTREEPVVLPARIPNLLVNGATGIAVGMATNIPPHNLNEVCAALLALLENPELKTHHLCKFVKGPDFPTGGQILNTPEQLKQIYKEGSGPVVVRATWELAPDKKSGKVIQITSIPYALNKSTLVENLAEVVMSRKLPQLIDVRDVSADDVCIQLFLKRDSDEQMVMAYLFKHTPLQSSFNVNLTCLLPTENPDLGRPMRSDLREILWNFLAFRLEVVTRRLGHELEALKRRIHILDGFVTVFDALDQIIKLIRASDGKADAAGKIMAKYKLDEEQTDAILELKLYRLAKLEVLVLREELEDKRKRAAAIQKLLKDKEGRWEIVGREIREIQDLYGKGDKRRSLIKSVEHEPEFSSEDFIVEEDNHVLVTTDGWVKRQREIKDPASSRLREGDSVLAVFGGSTRASCCFFSNFGRAYTCRFIDIPATTGYGEPIQKLFKLQDGERIVAACSLDPRVTPEIQAAKPEKPPPTHGVAVATDGYALRFSLEPFLEPSTRSGRRFAKYGKEAQIAGVEIIQGQETLIAVTRQARAILCPAEEVNFLSGPGRGVILLKVAKDDRLLGFKASRGERDLLEVETDQGGTRTISTAKYEVSGRGGKGREILKRGTVLRIVPAIPPAPEKGEGSGKDQPQGGAEGQDEG